MTKGGRAGLAPAALAAVAVTAAACGSGTVNSQASQSQDPLAAVSAATHATSYRFSVSEAMTGFGAAMSSLGFGGSGSGDVDIDATGAFSASEAALSEQLTESAGPASGPVTGRVLVFLHAGVAYVALNGGTARNPAKPWTKVTGISTTALGSQAGALSPAQFLEDITVSAVSEQRLGTVVVDGSPTTEYAIVVSTKQVMQKLKSNGALSGLLQAFGGAAASAAAKSTEAALNGLPPTMRYLVYVDQLGRLRRMVIAMPVGPMMGAIFKAALAQSAPSQAVLDKIQQAFDGVKETVTMDISDYGTPVSIVAPPADQVASTRTAPSGAGTS